MSNPSLSKSSTQIPSQISSADIHDHYIKALDAHAQPLPPRLAAVKALTQALWHHTPHTLSETLALLSDLSNALKDSVASAASQPQSCSAVPIAAGLDSFQHHLVTTLAPFHTNSKTSNDETQKAVLSAAHDYIARGLAAREKVAGYGRRFIRDGFTVVVPADRGLGSSAVVQGFLCDAARSGAEFRVVEVLDFHNPAPHTAQQSKRRAELKGRLEKAGVPGTTTTTSALAHTLSSMPRWMQGTETEFPADRTVLLMGATALTASGGVLVDGCRLSSAFIARGLGLEVWVASELGKSVRNLGLDTVGGLFGSRGDEDGEVFGAEGVMDVLPPDFITGVVTENGPASTEAVAEEAIRLWF